MIRYHFGDMDMGLSCEEFRAEALGFCALRSVWEAEPDREWERAPAKKPCPMELSLRTHPRSNLERKACLYLPYAPLATCRWAWEWVEAGAVSGGGFLVLPRVMRAARDRGREDREDDDGGVGSESEGAALVVAEDAALGDVARENAQSLVEWEFHVVYCETWLSGQRPHDETRFNRERRASETRFDRANVSARCRVAFQNTLSIVQLGPGNDLCEERNRQTTRLSEGQATPHALRSRLSRPPERVRIRARVLGSDSGRSDARFDGPCSTGLARLRKTNFGPLVRVWTRGSLSLSLRRFRAERGGDGCISGKPTVRLRRRSFEPRFGIVRPSRLRERHRERAGPPRGARTA